MAEELKSIVAAAVPGASHPRANLSTAAEDSGSYTDVRDSNGKRGETAAHAGLKRLALLWAQARGYAACALEVRLPQCRFRADVAVYRPARGDVGSTAIFECKQALPDLRRDNCQSDATREQLETLCRRRLVLEKNLRVHFPHLRIADSLFPEFASHDFVAINHRGYNRVLRKLSVLQSRLLDCTKFETLVRYRCANLFFVVVPDELFREPEIPIGWGALIESNDSLELVRKPLWQESPPEKRLHVLERIAAAGTRLCNAQLQITFDDVLAGRCAVVHG